MKRALAVCTTALLAIGLAVVGATSASAHTGDLNSTAVCNSTTGEYDVTYTLTTSNTALVGSTMWRVGTTTFESTPSSNAGMDRGPVSSTGAQTVTLGTISVPGTSTKAPWAYAFTTWTDNFTKGSDGGDIALAGNCSIPVVPNVDFSFSTVCGSLTLVTTTTNVNANWYYGTKASIGATQIGSAVVKGSGTKTTVIPFAEDSYGGSVDVDVETYASTEQDLLPDGWALGVKHTVTVNTDCKPPVVLTQCESLTDGGLSTNLDANGWDFATETRAKGHNEYVNGGLHVWTDSNDSQSKAAGYKAASFALKDAGLGAGINLSTNSGVTPPALQMLVDLNNDGTPEGYLVVENAYGPNTAWLSSNWSGLDISAAPTSINGGGTGKGGTINDWLAVWPDATVSAIGYSLGSGVQGDYVIHSITVGCAVYSFDYVDVPVEVNWNITPNAATCSADGSLPALTDGEHYTLAYDREFDGPGSYTVTATAKAGYVISGQSSKTLVVDGATGFQNSDAEASCYIPPKEDDVTTVNGTPACGETTVMDTVTTIHYVFNEETGEYTADEPVITHPVRQLTKDEITTCPPKLAYTGADTDLAIGLGVLGGFALLFGAAAIWVSRRNRSPRYARTDNE